MSSSDSINELIANIEEIQECIEYSNFNLMQKYLQVFLTSYSKTLVDIIIRQKTIGDEEATNYWTTITPKIIEVVRTGDIFGMTNILYFELKARLEDLLK